MRCSTSANRVARSVCPYGAVGCGQQVYVKEEKVVQIESDPHSPISRGRSCPKGSASKHLVTRPHREQNVLYHALYDIGLLLGRGRYLTAVADHTDDTP